MKTHSSKLVRYEIDLTKPPRLAPEQEVELAALAALPDDQIDTSDIPEVLETEWNGAIRGAFYRPIKRQITAKVDADVLDWLKSSGKGYQSRLNAILRREMMDALRQRSKAMPR